MSHQKDIDDRALALRQELTPLFEASTLGNDDYLMLSHPPHGAGVVQWSNRYSKTPFSVWEIRWSGSRNAITYSVVECADGDDPRLDLRVEHMTEHEFIASIKKLVAVTELANVVERKFRHWYPQLEVDRAPRRWFFRKQDTESSIPNNGEWLDFCVGGNSVRLKFHHVDSATAEFLAIFAEDSKKFEFERLPGGPCLTREQWMTEINYNFECYQPERQSIYGGRPVKWAF